MAGAAASHIDGLTERQRLAVRLLAQGKTIRETARTLGVSEKTIWSYRQKPVVQQAIYQYQTQAIEEGGGQSITSVPQAMATLQEILRDPAARDSDRIAASRAILSSAATFGERQLMERKLRDLEAALSSFAEGVTQVVTTAATPVEEPPEPLDPLLASADPEDYDE
jgi:hypothetical protein